MAERSHTLKRYSEFFGFAFDTFLLRRKRPYLFVLVINDKCNLDCYYCSLKNSGVYDLDAATVRSSLVTAYSRGSRALVVTGGEPMIWQDEGNRIQDIITLAKRIGFCDTAMFTNGTRPLDIPGITFIVTIDGTRESHNSIRKNSYDLVLSNVKDAKSPVIASITLLKSNANLLEESVRQIASTHLFKAITFNILTQTPDFLKQHGLLGEERNQVLDRIWRLKRDGYPIVLSRAAYLALRENSWRRPVEQIELMAAGQTFTCCRDVVNPEICQNCGYSSCAEISQAIAGKPSAIRQLLKVT